MLGKKMEQTKNFKSISLPDYFTYLLKIDIHKKGSLTQFLNTYILERPGFHGLLLNSFGKDTQGKSLDGIINSIGWYTLRAKIAGLFMSYKENGEFPEEIDPTNVDELLVFEEKIKPFTVEGYSRGLLFAFYLKMSQINDKDSKAFFEDSMIKLLTMTKIKTVKIDWLLFSLYQFYISLGEEKIIFLLKSNHSFKKIMATLNSDQRKRFFMDGLSYAYSINEKEALTNSVC